MHVLLIAMLRPLYHFTFTRLDNRHHWLKQATDGHDDGKDLNAIAHHPHHEHHEPYLSHWGCSLSHQSLHQNDQLCQIGG